MPKLLSASREYQRRRGNASVRGSGEYFLSRTVETVSDDNVEHIENDVSSDDQISAGLLLVAAAVK